MNTAKWNNLLQDERLFGAALLISVVPLWLTPFLPFVDLPQHVALVAGIHELFRGNPLFVADFEINWFTPYLAGYFLLFVLSSVMPIIIASKLALSMAIIAFPWITGILLREIGADQRLKWLAIPSGYSFAVYWGFFTYALAIPLAIGLLVLTVRFERAPTTRKAIGVALYAVALFFCHAIALGCASFLSLAYIGAKRWRSPKDLILCYLPYTAPLPVIALWTFRVFEAEASVQDSPILFGTVRERLTTLFLQFAGLDAAAFGVALLIVVIVLFLPLLLGCRLTKRPERWLLFAAGVGLYAVFPTYAQATAFLYQRIAVFVIPVWLVLWEPPERENRLFVPAVLVMLVAWWSVNTVRFRDFGRDTELFSEVLAEVPAGGHLAGMLLCNASPHFSNPVYLHYASWYQAVAGGVTDNSFALVYLSPIRYKDMARPRVGDTLAWYPQDFSWARDGGDLYDYYLVCSGVDAAEAIFKEQVAAVDLIAQNGPWWLYEKVADSH